MYIIFVDNKTRALLRLEKTMNLFGGREGGREGREGGREGLMEGGREGGREGGSEGGREGGEGGRDDCYTYSNRYVQ